MVAGPVPSGAGPAPVFGLVLAAGGGSRMGGRPKGLLRLASGVPFVEHAVRVLTSGGCARVLVVLGASMDDVGPLVPPGADVVVAPGWRDGMGASLRAGLETLAPTEAGAVIVGLVDTPGVTAEAVARLAALASPTGLARCSYDGAPGHPVLLGRSHWAGVLASAVGDHGARDYLRTRAVTLVEVGDVARGSDVDTPEQYVLWGSD